MKRKINLIIICIMTIILCIGNVQKINGLESTAGEDSTEYNYQKANDVEYTTDGNGNLIEVDTEYTETLSEEEMRVQNLKYASFRSNNVFVAKLRTKTANYNTNFTYDGGNGYLNGNYGGDAACINNYGSNINFMIAGVNGIMQNANSNYKLIPFSEAKSVSHYIVINGNLYHYIAKDVEISNSWFAINNLGKAPSYLNSDTKYYSYDGHYFYLNYETMISDYQKNEFRKNAINFNSPYYNYYQFVTVRTTSSLSVDEVYQYISTNHPGGALSNRATIQAFFDGQNKYGVNALLALAHAALESNWGKSSYAIERHNLFGINAGDSNPDDASYYSSDAACIDAYMNMISRYYMRPGSSTYHGGHYGDKASGISVSYASNAYGGELIAVLAMEIDRFSKDLNKYTIGVNEFTDYLNIRNAAVNGAILYNTNKHDFYPVTILDDKGEWYKIQSDPVLNGNRTGIDISTGLYSYSNCYGYVSSSYIKKINEGISNENNTSNVSGKETGKAESEPTLYYRANCQRTGWLDYVNEPNSAGTTGRGLSLYQLQFNFINSSKSSNLSARIYTTLGWKDYVNIEDDSLVGETNYAMQVVNFNLVNQPGYLLQYRVHSANVGWQDWVNQGSNAGVAGSDIQAIDFRVVEDKSITYKNSALYYQAHVSESGWLSYVPDSQIAGTIGQSLGLESFKIGFENEKSYNLNGYFITEDGKKTNFNNNGETSIGTTGKSLSLSAVNVNLSGISGLKLQYSVHISNAGWQDWVDEGTLAGNIANERIEAIRFRLIEDKSISSVSLNKNSINLKINSSEKLIATIQPSDTTDNRNLKWSSSDVSVAVVDDKGNVTAKKTGMATITVKTSNNKTASCKVVVVNEKPNINYTTHVQDIGWQSQKQDGEISGTSGQSKRLEAIRIQISDITKGNIEYRTHVQDIGWQSWKQNGEISGTSAQSKRLEAIQIKLTGAIAETYDVYYRVHAEELGWLDWTKNGEKAGTAGYGYRLEAIQIVLVKKGENAPGETKIPYIQKYIRYQSHIQDIGWQPERYDGQQSGTSGQSKRLEAIVLSLCNQEYSGSIEYRTHIQDIGWQGWRQNGQQSGTSGQSKRLEAIDIKLTGEMAENYDIYYRTHAQEFGWLDWAKNGEHAGTEGYGYRLEAIQIVLVKKGGAAPGNTENAFKKKSISYQSHINDIGWQNQKQNGEISGTQSENKRIEAIKINLNQQSFNGSIEYSSHIQDIGWQDWKRNGQISGTVGKSKQIEALRIRLTGEISNTYDIYYRVHAKEFGWLGWTKNGEKAGTEGFGFQLEAYQVYLVEKGSQAPGNTENPFYDFKVTNQIKSITTISDVDEIKGTFKVTVSNISSVFPVSSVSIPVWCESNQKDIYWYPAIKQNDGSFTVTVDAKNHKYHNGNYIIHTYIKNNYGSNVNTNVLEQDMKVTNVFESEYQGNGFQKIYFSNYEELPSLKFAVYSQSEGENSKKWFTPKSEGYGIYSILISGNDFRTLGNFKAEAYSNNQLIKQTEFAIKRMDYTPAYYSQTDPNWANKWYGGYKFGPTGCVPTSIAMALSSLANVIIKPIAVADYLFGIGMYNVGGAGAGSLAVKYATEHWGYRSSAIMSYDELVNQLKMNKIVCAAVGRGYFVHGNYTHEIVLYGFNNGKTYVKDPINSSANGWYSIWDIWVQQSTDPNDKIGGSVFYSMYD